MYQINALYTLHLHNAIRQLNLTKAGKKNREMNSHDADSIVQVSVGKDEKVLKSKEESEPESLAVAAREVV